MNQERSCLLVSVINYELECFFAVPVENISPTVRVKYFEGASVVCKADGYPAPSYTWTNLDTDETSSGSTLSISVNGVGNYACEATNTIRGVTETIRTTVTTDIEEGKHLGGAHNYFGCVVTNRHRRLPVSLVLSDHRNSKLGDSPLLRLDRLQSWI